MKFVLTGILVIIAVKAASSQYHGAFAMDRPTYLPVSSTKLGARPIGRPLWLSPPPGSSSFFDSAFFRKRKDRIIPLSLHPPILERPKPEKTVRKRPKSNSKNKRKQRKQRKQQKRKTTLEYISTTIEYETTTEIEITTTTTATTQAPTTKAPTTKAPTTKAPTTKAPTTHAPTTQAPTTHAPTTKAPTTRAPTTQAPTTQKPTTRFGASNIIPKPPSLRKTSEVASALPRHVYNVITERSVNNVGAQIQSKHVLPSRQSYNLVPSTPIDTMAPPRQTNTMVQPINTNTIEPAGQTYEWETPNQINNQVGAYTQSKNVLPAKKRHDLVPSTHTDSLSSPRQTHNVIQPIHTTNIEPAGQIYEWETPNQASDIVPQRKTNYVSKSKLLHNVPLPGQIKDIVQERQPHNMVSSIQTNNMSPQLQINDVVSIRQTDNAEAPIQAYDPVLQRSIRFERRRVAHRKPVFKMPKVQSSSVFKMPKSSPTSSFRRFSDILVGTKPSVNSRLAPDTLKPSPSDGSFGRFPIGKNTVHSRTVDNQRPIIGQSAQEKELPAKVSSIPQRVTSNSGKPFSGPSSNSYESRLDGNTVDINSEMGFNMRSSFGGTASMLDSSVASPQSMSSIGSDRSENFPTGQSKTITRQSTEHIVSHDLPHSQVSLKGVLPSETVNASGWETQPQQMLGIPKSFPPEVREERYNRPLNMNSPKTDPLVGIQDTSIASSQSFSRVGMGQSENVLISQSKTISRQSTENIASKVLPHTRVSSNNVLPSGTVSASGWETPPQPVIDMPKSFPPEIREELNNRPLNMNSPMTDPLVGIQDRSIASSLPISTVGPVRSENIPTSQSKTIARHSMENIIHQDQTQSRVSSKSVLPSETVSASGWETPSQQVLGMSKSYPSKTSEEHYHGPLNINSQMIEPLVGNKRFNSVDSTKQVSLKSQSLSPQTYIGSTMPSAIGGKFAGRLRKQQSIEELVTQVADQIFPMNTLRPMTTKTLSSQTENAATYTIDQPYIPKTENVHRIQQLNDLSFKTGTVTSSLSQLTSRKNQHEHIHGTTTHHPTRSHSSMASKTPSANGMGDESDQGHVNSDKRPLEHGFSQNPVASMHGSSGQYPSQTYSTPSVGGTEMPMRNDDLSLVSVSSHTHQTHMSSIDNRAGQPGDTLSTSQQTYNVAQSTINPNSNQGRINSSEQKQLNMRSKENTTNSGKQNVNSLMLQALSDFLAMYDVPSVMKSGGKTINNVAVNDISAPSGQSSHAVSEGKHMRNKHNINSKKGQPSEFRTENVSNGLKDGRANNISKDTSVKVAAGANIPIHQDPSRQNLNKIIEGNKGQWPGAPPTSSTRNKSPTSGPPPPQFIRSQSPISASSAPPLMKNKSPISGPPPPSFTRNKSPISGQSPPSFISKKSPVSGPPPPSFLKNKLPVSGPPPPSFIRNKSPISGPPPPSFLKNKSPVSGPPPPSFLKKKSGISGKGNSDRSIERGPPGYHVPAGYHPPVLTRAEEAGSSVPRGANNAPKNKIPITGPPPPSFLRNKSTIPGPPPTSFINRKSEITGEVNGGRYVEGEVGSPTGYHAPAVAHPPVLTRPGEGGGGSIPWDTNGAQHSTNQAPVGNSGPGQGACTMAPVCGSDGFTYMSSCFLSEGFSVVCDGYCPCPEQPMMMQTSQQGVLVEPVPGGPHTQNGACNCPPTHNPVCAMSGATYDNVCESRCIGEVLACNGECPCPQPGMQDHQQNLGPHPTPIYDGAVVNHETNHQQNLSPHPTPIYDGANVHREPHNQHQSPWERESPAPSHVPSNNVPTNMPILVFQWH